MPPRSQVGKEIYPKAPNSMRDVLRAVSELCYALQAIEKAEARARTSKKPIGSDVVGWKERVLELAVQKAKGVSGQVDSLLLRHCQLAYSGDDIEDDQNTDEGGDELSAVAQAKHLQRIETKLSELVDWVGKVEKVYEKDDEETWRLVNTKDDPSASDASSHGTVCLTEEIDDSREGQGHAESVQTNSLLMERLAKIEAQIVELRCMQHMDLYQKGDVERRLVSVEKRIEFVERKVKDIEKSTEYVLRKVKSVERFQNPGVKMLHFGKNSGSKNP